MELIEIDKNRCIQCGVCVKECPTFVLEMGKEGPKTIREQNCFSCGHCVAVCTKNALNNRKAPLRRQKDRNMNLNFNTEAAEQFLRSRRSIRSYKQNTVPRELLSRLVDLAR